ncbi:NlpC/P60 family protein [Luteipulveratus halotolerans]|uniref:NlpC/P60 family protein n=1 Tax=Luteipulveratus halotolerans TaxID=1631356 RepID=UPI000681CE2A|nr:NlpC/P60 family protein [Luteipulveratus halotolerans]
MSLADQHVPRRSVLLGAGVVGVTAVTGGVLWATWPDGPNGPPPSTYRPITADELRVERDDRAGLTRFRDGDGHLVATCTDQARTVTVRGPRRTLAEAETTAATVLSDSRVHLLPAPWAADHAVAATWRPWLVQTHNHPPLDVIDVCFQYVVGAPERVDSRGVRYAGDASYGPLGEDSESRLEASDFYDYLGRDWTFADGETKKYERRRLGAADCSGYLRLVLGYRLGLPLLSGNKEGPGLPRRAYAMAEHGPGRQLFRLKGERPGDHERDLLLPGDLVFFVTDGEDGIDHVGLFLGLDSDGRHRFISSRKKVDGPTMGDVGGLSVLDGKGLYARGWRSARRL